MRRKKSKRSGEINPELKVRNGAAIKYIASIVCFSMVVLACTLLFFSPLYILLPIALFFIALGCVLSFLDYKKKPTLFKSLFVLLITTAIIALAYMIMYRTGILNSLDDIETISGFIRGAGFWGAFIFILIVVLNVMLLPIPFGVIAVVGSLIYGPLLAFVYMSIGMLIGSIAVFAIARRFGNRLVVWMLGKEKTEKYSNFINKKGRLAFIFMIIFPFFPDDILCLIAGISKMSWKFFIFVICSIRIAVLAVTCFFSSGSVIPFSGWGIPVWIAIAGGFVLAFILTTVIKRRIAAKRKG